MTVFLCISIAGSALEAAAVPFKGGIFSTAGLVRTSHPPGGPGRGGPVQISSRPVWMSQSSDRASQTNATPHNPSTATQPADPPGVSVPASVVVADTEALGGQQRFSPGVQVGPPETGMTPAMSIGTTRSELPLHQENVVLRVPKKRISRGQKIARIVGLAVALPLAIAILAYPVSKLLVADERPRERPQARSEPDGGGGSFGDLGFGPLGSPANIPASSYPPPYSSEGKYGYGSKDGNPPPTYEAAMLGRGTPPL